ncbi:hypothetical protein [Streptomyces sp. NPDC048442]|uniref:hypothetical protein n=1 Tax=Streptomyces sp. NPDC048442 TaxID=3154823 RepID=UPI003442BF42
MACPRAAVKVQARARPPAAPATRGHVPLLFSLLVALSRWSGFRLEDIRPADTENCAALFSRGSTFLTPVLTSTLLYALGTVVLPTAGAVLIATFISRLRFQGLRRTLYFLPMGHHRGGDRERLEIHAGRSPATSRPR